MDIRNFFGVSKQLMLLSRNAATARSGNSAERRLCDNARVRESLSTYFGKPIATIALVPGRQKSDVTVLFEDNTTARIQNKEGDGNNRGWSIDRRSLTKLPLDDQAKLLLDNVCLKHEGERPEVPCPEALISEFLLGSNPDSSPTHFTHSLFNESGDLLRLEIAPAEEVLSALKSTLYPTLVPKRTCVHMSPLIYLQRKGGGSKDHAPNDIQVKLKEFPKEVMRTIFSS